MILVRMAQHLKAQTIIFIQTGSVPIIDKLSGEVLAWTSYILPILGMILFGCFAWLLLPFAYLLVPFIMKTPVETRERRRRKEKFAKQGRVPLVGIDARKMSVSNYMVDPPWVFICCRTSRWWNSFYEAMSTVSKFVHIPLRWSQKWAILWPPPGIITTAMTLFFICVVHLVIFVRLLLLCLKSKYHDKKLQYSNQIQFLQLFFKMFNHLRGSITVQEVHLRNTLQVLTTFALTSKEAELHNHILTWDSDSIPAVVDNSANTHIWTRLEDFVEGSLHYFEDSDNVSGVITIGDDASKPIGIGSVNIRINTNEGTMVNVELERALYFPKSPVNVISVTYLAHQFGDEDGTWVQTKMQSSQFTWNFGKHSVDLIHPSSNLPVLNVLPGNSASQSFCSLFEQSGVMVEPIAMTTCQTCLPCDSSQDLCFLSDMPPQAQGDPRYRFTDKEVLEQVFNVGETLRLTKNGVNAKVTVISIRLDEETQVPYFLVELPDSHEVEVTQEFLFPIDAEDLVHVPVTKKQVQSQIDILTPESLEALLNPPEQSELLKEFMAWHVRLGHIGFPVMFKQCKVGLLPRRFLALEKKRIICPHCSFGKAKRRAWRSKSSPGHIRSEKDTQPGDATSMDHIISAQPGLVPRMDSKHTKDRIVAGCVFFDHVSGHSYTHLQTSVDNTQTIEAKRAYERFAQSHGVNLKRFHADNGIFAELKFRNEIDATPHQSITYCAVGAHHQNGLVERSIGTLTLGARTNLLYAQRKWPEAIGTILWPFAWKDFERKYNHLKFDDNGLAPINKFSGTTVAPDLRQYHPFGCPIFVLDSKLQSTGGSVPKWNPRARVGVYLGHSPCHAGSVALVLNPKTLIVSPQFHVVFDDEFSTVPFMRDGEVPPHWRDLVQHSAEVVSGDDFDLATTWANAYLNNEATTVNEEDDARDKMLLNHHPELIDQDITTPSEEDITEDEEGDLPVLGSQIEDANDETVTNSLLFPTLPDLNNLSCRRSKRQSKSPKRFGFLTKQILSAFVVCSALIKGVNTIQPRTTIATVCNHFETVNNHLDGTINSVHHAFMAANAGDNDVYTLKQMLQQEDKNDFIQAMVSEIDDHCKRDHWTVVPRSEIPKGTKTILSVWPFKRKRYPDGRIIKHKARLNAHGGMQTWGVDYWETYAPVVNWLSVRTMMTLSVIHDLESRSIDFVQAFPQADLEVPVWMELPWGFGREGSKNYVLKLNKNLYGLCNASRNFWEFLKDGLKSRGFSNQSSADQCVFYAKEAILLVYVDDCIILQKKDSKAADNLIRDLQEGNEKFEFTDDGNLEKYLGVDVKKNPNGSIELTQKHLIQRLLQVIGIDDKVNPRPTPAIKPLLFKDLAGLTRKHVWNYRQAIGMLNYLSGTTRPDIAMAVHQAARFCIDPKLSHERAIYRLGKYLLGTMDQGIIIKPDTTKGLECFVDADFAGGWNVLDADETSSVYSRTGYVIMYAGCPLHWISKLQSEVSLSTTESEYIALSQAMRDVIPLIDLLEEIDEIIPVYKPKPRVHCKVWEDNEGCVSLATQQKFSPRTKHIAVKYHHFREKVNNGTVSIHSIDTKEQTADIFTKPLDESLFKYLRKKLSGW